MLDSDPYQSQRQAMVKVQLVRRGITDPDVLSAMATTPRHLFVPAEQQASAYDDTPIPIGYEQTISQPYIVAVMTQLLRLKPGSTVLEIGVGSGYQTAILAQLAGFVTGIERIPDLAATAQRQLSALGITNVEIHVGDGSLGYLANAPYDAIISAAASPKIPQPLLDQLNAQGVLVAPTGERHLQQLTIAQRFGDSIQIDRLGDVRFVPLIGWYGFED